MSAPTPVEGHQSPGELDVELADELDVELEVEAAEMAPLVEIPDRDSHSPRPAKGTDVTIRMRGLGRVPARKSRRVFRRVGPLSVLKLSFAFSLCLLAVVLIASLLLWSAAVGAGSLDNIESFVVDLGFDNFRLVGADLFRGLVVFGAALVVANTVFSVVVALLFNLISDLVGGIRFTVIEPLVPPEPVSGHERADEQ